MILDRLAWTEWLIDNAGLMPVNDLDAIEDLKLYDRLPNEFPRWLAKAREQGILAA